MNSAIFNDIMQIKAVILFVAKTITLALSPSSWDSSTKSVLIKQIYFTSVQILPLFLIISIFFGATIVGAITSMLSQLDLIDRLGDLAISFIFTELAPITTTSLIILRSSTATNSEIAVMRVNRELDSLMAFGIDPIRYLAMPRMINMTISIASLSTIFIIISIFFGAIIATSFFDINFSQYLLKIVQYISIDILFFLYLKTTLFAITISVIPIYFGINSLKMLSYIPISVLRGMVSIFKTILFIEVMIFLLKLL